MATLQSYVNQLPAVFRLRYTNSGFFVVWGNQLLEEFQERGFLSSYKKEIGRLVTNKSWISKPSDFLFLHGIHYPTDENQKFRVEDINNKFKLKDATLDYDVSEADEATVLSVSATDSIKVNITDKNADEYESFLFYISGGTLAGDSEIIASNDATDSGVTKLYYLHERSAAFVISGLTPEVSAARMIPPYGYVIMKYQASITQLSLISDEIPVPTDCEARLVPAYLRWCCEKETLATSAETKYWESEVAKIFYGIQAKRSTMVNFSRGRRLVGFEKDLDISKPHPDYSEFS